MANVLEFADSGLVRAARQGDRTAFGCLYQRYRGMVHAILLARVSRTEAEDLVQDVFLHAMQRLPGLREEKAFGGWLATMARRFSIDHVRRARPMVEATEAACGPAAGGEAETVLRTIRGLPEAYRETLMMRLVEGMTGPEIADRAGLTQDSVRVNLCRGMKLLRQRLEGRVQGG